MSQMIRRVHDWLHEVRLAWWMDNTSRNEQDRQIDIETLWPVVRDQSADLREAHTSFMMYACSDDAWADLDMEQLETVVMKLR